MKKKLSIILLEAVLIFGSVYAAFLLEDRRSKNFEREMLRDRLEDHIRILKLDSANFDERLGNRAGTPGEGLHASLDKHEEVMRLLKLGTRDDFIKVYEMHRSNQLFWRVIQRVTKSQHQFESLRESYEHLFLLDSTAYFMEQYQYHSWIINTFAQYADEQFEELNTFGLENYFVLTDNEKNEDILEFVSHPLYYNTIFRHKNTVELLIGFKKEYDEYFSKILNYIQKEIDEQNKIL